MYKNKNASSKTAVQVSSVPIAKLVPRFCKITSTSRFEWGVSQRSQPGPQLPLDCPAVPTCPHASKLVVTAFHKTKKYTLNEGAVEKTDFINVECWLLN